MIAGLTHVDLGRWVEFTVPATENVESVVMKGRIKAYDNSRMVAWVVFKAEGHLEEGGNTWKEYPAEKIDYSSLTFFEMTKEGPQQQIV